MTLPIWVLYTVAVAAASLILAALLLPIISHVVELVDAKHRRRHAARRRGRARGYLPIFDDKWDPRS